MEAQITIKANNLVELNAKTEALQKLEQLPTDVIVKLAELSQNKKAVDTFMNPPSWLKPLLK